MPERHSERFGPEGEELIADDERSGRLERPARAIVPPTTVSAEARRFLSTPRPPFQPWPALDDVAGWREAVARSNAIFALIHEVYHQNFAGELQKRKIGGVSTYELVPHSIPERNRNRVLLFLHGGAYVFGGGSLAGANLRDPYLSPVFGDFSKGFCPTYLQSGTRDLLLSNTVLLHRALRRAGIEADLNPWEAMRHAGFLGATEDAESTADQLRFLDYHLGA
jgi:acetyl esterase/lipase